MEYRYTDKNGNEIEFETDSLLVACDECEGSGEVEHTTTGRDREIEYTTKCCSDCDNGFNEM